MPAMNRPGFFTKAGLRRLLTADEVWSLGRKRSLGEYNIPTEQEILQTTGSKDLGDPKCFSAYNHQSKPCHNTSTDRKVKREDGKPSHKQELLKANTKPHGYEPKPVKNGKSPHLKRSQTKSTEINSREKVHWQSLKDLHHLTSEHNQPSCKTSDKVPIGSCLSSDIEEDLPYDYEDIQQKPREETEARFQEELNYSSFEMTVDCDKVITNNLTLNVKNSQQSVIFNNNHEICNVSRELNTAYTQTHETDLVSQISEKLKWQNIEDSMIDKQLVTNSVVPVSSGIKGTDSLSCNDSLSEAEDKSEPFSLQSEGLVWSEEEKDAHSEEKFEAGTFSLVYSEKSTVIPESPLNFHKSNNEHCKVDSYGLTLNEKHITTESNLSEILSPVDEVLSYGSAELPSSHKGGGRPGLNINSLASPSPAFEIITWTSEEDLPAPADFLEDPSINSENIPLLPVDLSCKKYTKLPSETSVNNDANKGDLCQMLHSAEEDQEDEGSEYSSSFPVDDSEDSFFNIGDRVLVCNSRPGVLKYKGYTTFAEGLWAGVVLDTAKGNHNGTFRGVKYFTCQNSCGVLVRAEDISHLHGEQYNDADTRMDKDFISDEDPPNNQDGINGNTSYRKGQRKQSGRHCSSRHGFSAPTQTFQQEPCENDKASDNALPMFLTSSEQTPLNNFRKKEAGNVINKPGLMDKWQQVYPVTPPQIRVKPHEHSIVYKLVDNMVETLYGQANRSALDACETPSYLVDDESCKTYRRVLFQLASDVLKKICADLLKVSGTFQKTMDKSVISLVQTRQISVNLLKDAVKRETQKVLNLGKNDQQMTEMLQTLCKFWYAKRDKVDYILIQELYNEEQEWVDYSNDQITVKMQLANDIFSYLLDDTISVLNQIYVADNK